MSASGFATDLFAGRRVLVTGAAGGIGLATARLFGRLGARLVLLDRDSDELAAARNALAATGAEASTHLCDLGQAEDVARCAADLAADGPVSALVNCAGVFVRAPLEAPDAVSRWDATLGVNVRGAFLMARACLQMLRATGGTITNVSSVRAVTAAENAVAYTASKGALNALTVALAHALGPDGIRVNAVAPGDVATPMNSGQDARTDALLTRSALKRMGTPDEIAAAIVFLASPLSSFTTGSVLTVDGGFLAG